MDKAPDAFRTISEVAEELDVPQHVLRFWESRFREIKPLKRGGGRRYYRPEDVNLLRGIRHLLYGEGYTIRGVQRLLREQGIGFVQDVWQPGAPQPAADVSAELAEEPIEHEPDENAPAPRASFHAPPVPPSLRMPSAVSSPAPVRAVQGLPQEDQRRLTDVLRELGECRKLLDAARSD